MCDNFKDYREVFLPRKKREGFMEPLRLRYCDSGTLFTLLSTLNKLESSKLHRKVNYYLWKTLKAIGIILECLDSPPAIKVRAIGQFELPEPLVFKANCDFVKRIINEKYHTRLLIEELEGKLACELDRILKEEYHDRFRNSIFYAIEHPTETDRYPFFVGLVNYKEFECCEEIYEGIVTECLRNCYGMLRSASNYETELENSKCCSTILNAYVEILSLSGTNLMHEKIQRLSMEVFNSSKCSFFIRDPEHGLAPVAVPLGKLSNEDENSEEDEDKYNDVRFTTTAEKVLEIGKLININIVDDEPLYKCFNNKMTGNCRSLLSFPLKLEGKILGVIELYDKNSPSMKFTDEDKKMTIPFGNVVSFAMDTNKIFYHFLDLKAKNQFTDCMLLRRVKKEENEVVNSVLHCDHKHNFHRVTDFRFDPTTIPQKHILCICLRIFEASGLLKKFRVKKETFIRFLVKVKDAHSPLGFLGWNHAFLTLHFVFVCVNQYNLIKERYVTIFEYFTLLLAALCHGIDYRGPTTMFQKMAGTVLATVFSSPGSIHQLHQLSQTLRLITSPDCNILQHIEDENFYSLATLLKEMYLDIDLSRRLVKHLQLQEIIETGYKVEKNEHRRLFHYLILNCAQACFVCKPWSICRSLGMETYEALYRKGDLKMASDVFDLPDYNEDLLKLPDFNLHFIEKICIPNYTYLANICPMVNLCLLKIRVNMVLWKEEKDKIMAELTKATDIADNEVGEE